MISLILYSTEMNRELVINDDNTYFLRLKKIMKEKRHHHQNLVVYSLKSADYNGA